MVQCKICKKETSLISGSLHVCLDCIREEFATALPYIRRAHSKSRAAFQLPQSPPKHSDGIACNVCINECVIPESSSGYCGLRRNIGRYVVGASATQANVSWYYDPLPTNCVADWVCPEGTGRKTDNAKRHVALQSRRKYNLAVFFQACSFDCLYCQNWHFREQTFNPNRKRIEDFIAAAENETACVCFFGGDPTPQLPFAIKASREILERNKHKIIRICWETNGSMHPRLLKTMIDLSFKSSGIIKFDLKAWSESAHIALTGATNKRTFENFALVADRMPDRPDPPLLVASTLLVPGYVDEVEVRNIARFIASLNPDIPYTLLGFAPQFQMPDLPFTSLQFAKRCSQIAQDEGLKRVKIGNLHILH